MGSYTRGSFSDAALVPSRCEREGLLAQPCLYSQRGRSEGTHAQHTASCRWRHLAPEQRFRTHEEVSLVSSSVPLPALKAWPWRLAHVGCASMLVAWIGVWIGVGICMDPAGAAEMCSNVWLVRVYAQGAYDLHVMHRQGWAPSCHVALSAVLYFNQSRVLLHHQHQQVND